MESRLNWRVLFVWISNWIIEEVFCIPKDLADCINILFSEFPCKRPNKGKTDNKWRERIILPDLSILTDISEQINDRPEEPTSIRIQPSPRNITPAIVGIPNLGNTCFMNSVLQCLVSVSIFTNYITRMNPSSPLEASLKALTPILLGQNSNINRAISDFKRKLESEYPDYCGFQMHDQKKFLGDLITSLRTCNEDFVKKFLTITKLVYTCKRCGYQLDIDNEELWAGCKRAERDKTASIQRFVNNQIMDCGPFDCDQCGTPEMMFEKNRIVCDVADVLVVYLGEHNGSSYEATTYPEKISVKNRQYQLKAVCAGTSNHGVAVVNRAGRWFYVSDDHYQPVGSCLTDLSVLLFYEVN